MKTLNEFHIAPVDIHAAIARAHLDRARHIRLAAIKVPALLKGLAAKLRHGRAPHPRYGAWA